MASTETGYRKEVTDGTLPLKGNTLESDGNVTVGGEGTAKKVLFKDGDVTVERSDADELLFTDLRAGTKSLSDLSAIAGGFAEGGGTLFMDAQSTNTTALTGTETPYVWDTENVDAESAFDGTTYIIPADGVYLVTVILEFAISSAGITAYLRKNSTGSLGVQDVGNFAGAATDSGLISGVHSLAEGDTLHVGVLRTNGSGGTVRGRRFQVTRVNGDSLKKLVEATGNQLSVDVVSGPVVLGIQNEIVDPENTFASNTFTAPRTKDYLVIVNARLNYFAFTGNIALRKNGVTVLGVNYQGNPTIGTETNIGVIAQVVALTATDTLAVYWTKTAGSGTGQLTVSSFQVYELDGVDTKPLVEAQGTSQTYAASDTAVEFTTEVLDVDSAWAVDTYTVPRTGTYRFLLAVRLVPTAGSNTMRIFLDKNAGTLLAESFHASPGGGTWEDTVTIDVTFDLIASDVIKVFSNATNTSGTYTGLYFHVLEIQPLASAGGSFSLIVKNDGTNVANTPHAAINATGAGITASDGGGGVATLNVPGTPVGSASGGLGGTYPGPTVNGMTSGVLADDPAHGSRGGAALHALAIAAVANGFMSGADKAKLDGIATGANNFTGNLNGGDLSDGSGSRPVTVNDPNGLEVKGGTFGTDTDATVIKARDVITPANDFGVATWEAQIAQDAATNIVTGIVAHGGGFMIAGNHGDWALIFVQGASVPVKLGGSANVTITKDSASAYNFYVESGNLIAQNKRIGTQSMRVIFVGDLT